MTQARLAEFVEKWDTKYPPVVQLWRRNWDGCPLLCLSGRGSPRVIYRQFTVEAPLPNCATKRLAPFALKTIFPEQVDLPIAPALGPR